MCLCTGMYIYWGSSIKLCGIVKYQGRNLVAFQTALLKVKVIITQNRLALLLLRYFDKMCTMWGYFVSELTAQH